MHLIVIVQSVAQLYWTLWDPMDSSTSGFPVLHNIPEFAQTHVHWIGDVIQPSHPLSSPSPPAPNPSQHQSLPMSQLFASDGQSIGASASVLSVDIQGWFPLELSCFISLLPKGFSKVFSTTIWMYQFFCCCSAFFIVQLSYPYMTSGKIITLTMQTFVGKV